MVKKLIQALRSKVLKEADKSPEEAPKPSEPEKSSSRPPRSRRRSQSSQSSKPEDQWSLDSFEVEPKADETRFHDFDLPLPIMHGIHDLGFKYCTPIQAKVLRHVGQGQNIAGRAQTGTGKTAAFLIRTLARFLADRGGSRRPGTPRALILAPTRELVLQIIKDADDLGKYCSIRSFAVFGGMDFEKQRQELLQRRVDLIAATPGRLLDFKRRGVLDLKKVEVLVIDEADRMLDMGFIPDVSQIIRATPPKDKRQTMLFSATLTDHVLQLASRWMPDPAFCEVEAEKVAVDTVKQVVYIVSARDKFKLLYNILSQEDTTRVLIFGNRRDSTKRLADNLVRHAIPCEYLSGTVRQEKRLKVLESFRKGRTRIVVATDVAGRGLHVDKISHVINYEFPYEAEDYVHRIGRTGRAGLEGTAISFACEEESFVIPEIEKYIGESLECVMPDSELLAATPPPSVRVQRSRDDEVVSPPRSGRPSSPSRRGGPRPGARRPRR